MLLYVGWLRTGWTYWEPVTGKPTHKHVAEDRLNAVEVRKGEPDGAKVLLPAGETPIIRKSQEGE